MCNKKKGFSLLRPFDLEAAKRGETVCFDDGDTPAAWFIHDGMLFVEWADEPQRFVQFASHEFKNWRMAPLCWVRTSVEDDTLKPVYKGDVLYNSRGQRRTVTGINEHEVLHTEEHGSLTVHKDDCTWTPPKAKRKIKMLGYKDVFDGGILLRDVVIEDQSYWKRFPQIDTTIEIEE